MIKHILYGSALFVAVTWGGIGWIGWALTKQEIAEKDVLIQRQSEQLQRADYQLAKMNALMKVAAEKLEEVRRERDRR